MILNDALHDLAAATSELPEAAMQWALDHWDETGPLFVSMLDAYARGLDRSEPTECSLFFTLHLIGEKGETAAFGPLCELLLEAEASELVLGDAITATLPRILINTYDTDLAALTAVVEATGAEEFVRQGALLAMAYLARTGRIPETEMRACLLGWRKELRPQSEHMVWAGWVLAVAHLGFADLAEIAEELIRCGFVPTAAINVANFRQDLSRTLDDPKCMDGFIHDGIGAFGSAVEELQDWEFSRTGRSEFFDDVDSGVRQPVHNPWRGVGRNDPCPCGSGKKFKNAFDSRFPSHDRSPVPTGKAQPSSMLRSTASSRR